MRPFLTAILCGALAASAVVAQPPFLPRDRDRDHDRDRDRGASREAQDQVTQWSLRFFGQKPDPDSRIFWARQLDRSNNPDQTLAAMLGNNDYYLRTGGRPRQYVATLLHELTGHDPSRRDMEYWMDRLFRSGGEAPSDQDRIDLVYDMLRRYPQGGPPPRADDDYDYRRPDRP